MTPSDITSDVNMEINNKHPCCCQKWCAPARETTTVGGIATGDAYAGINLLNILNSRLSLTDWLAYYLLTYAATGTATSRFSRNTTLVLLATDQEALETDRQSPVTAIAQTLEMSSALYQIHQLTNPKAPCICLQQVSLTQLQLQPQHRTV